MKKVHVKKTAFLPSSREVTPPCCPKKAIHFATSELKKKKRSQACKDCQTSPYHRWIYKVTFPKLSLREFKRLPRNQSLSFAFQENQMNRNRKAKQDHDASQRRKYLKNHRCFCSFLLSAAYFCIEIRCHRLKCHRDLCVESGNFSKRK